MGILDALGRTTIKSLPGTQSPQELVDAMNKSSDNMLTRVQSLGYDKPKPQQNFFSSLMGNLGRTGYAANNLIREFTAPDSGATPDRFDPLDAIGRGFTLKERPIGRDVLQDFGINGKNAKGQESFWTPAGIGGLALDVVNPLDALNWLGFGLGKNVVKGGVKGVGALEKAFGAEAAASIAEAIGKDATEKLGAKSVGKLINQVSNVAQKSITDEDALSKLMASIREGMATTGSRATTKLPYNASKNITVGLQNPFNLMGDPFLSVDVPGSHHITGAVKAGFDKIGETKIGDSIARAFSTKHVPKTMPDSVVVKDLSGRLIDNEIERASAGQIHTPLTVDELTMLRRDLDEVKPVEGEQTSFDSIAKMSGVDPTTASLLFEKHLPFAMDINDIYHAIKGVSEGLGSVVNDKETYIQAAKLRKTMDLLEANIPDELMPFFKGTMMSSGPIKSYEGSPLKDVDQRSSASPMVNFVFDVNGVDVFAGINTSNSFNMNIWSKLGATIETLQKMLPENIQVLKDKLQISPLPLGRESGANIKGYAIGDSTIVLGDVTPFTAIHEFGHVMNEAVGNDFKDYAKSMELDGKGMLNQFGPAEDFSDALAKYKLEGDKFKTDYPNRAKHIDDVLAATKTDHAELEKLIKAQNARAEKIANMPNAEKQLNDILTNIDEYVAKNLDKFNFTEGSEAFTEARQQLAHLFESTSMKTEDFVRQVEAIFKHVPVEERKQIMDLASRGYLKPVAFSKVELGDWEIVKGHKSEGLKLKDFSNRNNGVYISTVKSHDYKWLSRYGFEQYYGALQNIEFSKGDLNKYLVSFASSVTPKVFGTIEEAKKFAEEVINNPDILRQYFKEDSRVVKHFDPTGLDKRYAWSVKNKKDLRYKIIENTSNKLPYLDRINENRDRIAQKTSMIWNSGPRPTIDDFMEDYSILTDLEKVPTERKAKEFWLKNIGDDIHENISLVFGSGKNNMGVELADKTFDLSDPDQFSRGLVELLTNTIPFPFELTPKDISRVIDMLMEENKKGINGGFLSGRTHTIIDTKNGTEVSYGFSSQERAQSWIDNMIREEPADIKFSKEYAPTFYSKLQSTVAEKVGGSIHPTELMNLLRASGVKEEEILWSGVKDLENRKYTKQELQEYLKGNEIQVEEVFKGGKVSNEPINMGKQIMESEWWTDSNLSSHFKGMTEDYLDKLYRDVHADETGELLPYIDQDLIDRFGASRDAADELLDVIYGATPQNMSDNPAKYEDYKEPGGKDYTELLFTLPVGFNDLKGPEVKAMQEEYKTINAEILQLENQIGEFSRTMNRGEIPSEEIQLEFEQAVNRRRQLLNRAEDIENTPGALDMPQSAYDSNHWQEPNVLAHTRFDTRQVGDEKVLFVQEIQSDWHQAGRKEGYKEFVNTDVLKKLENIKILENELNQMDFMDWASDYPSKKAQSLLDEIDLRKNEVKDLGVDPDNPSVGSISHAPFEKTWPEFVMKRLIRYAAENGYDRIAWTTGAQQNARYSLSKTVDRLEYWQHPDGMSSLRGSKNDGFITRNVVDKEVSPRDLPSYVGEEVAAKLLDPGSRGLRVKKTELPHTVMGEKAYQYTIVDKHGHDWGNHKYGSEESAQKALDEHRASGQRKTVVAGSTLDVGGSGMKGFYDNMLPTMVKKMGKKYGLKLENLDLPETGLQPSFAIPDAMKDDVLYKGQPMFKKGEEAVGQLSDEGQAALDAFTKWRDSVVKTYKAMGVPIRELENYVPFVPMRSLKPDEAKTLSATLGTGNKRLNNPENVDDLLSYLSKTDYNLKERTTQAKSPADVNKLLDKEWLTEDAAIAMSLRGIRAIKAQEVTGFLNEFVSKYGLTVADITKSARGQIPSGYKMYYTKVNENGSKVLQEIVNPAGAAEKEISTFFLPEDMAKLYNEYSEMIMGGSAKNPVLKAYDNLTSVYKKVAYLWNPGHIPRDLAGNLWNGFLMGVSNPGEYIRAIGLLKDPKQMVNVAGKEMSVDELLRKAQEMGALDVGAALAETPRDIIDRLNIPNKNVVSNAVSWYSTIMREGTRKSDLFTRFTGLMHEIDKGKTLTEAVVQVKKFYFDYFDLTPFERKVMKRIMPFYTWLRKNVPLQIEQFIKNPRTLSRVGDVMNSAEGEGIDWENRPEYITSTGATKMGNSGIYAAPNMPYNDLSKVPTSMDALLQILSGTNPIIRAPLEMATNTQWFNGRPLEDYPGEQRPAPFSGLLNALGVENNATMDKRVLGHLFDQVPIARNLDIMTDPEHPRQVSRASTFIGGPAIYSQESVDRSAAYEDQRNLANLIKQLKDSGVDVPKLKDLNKTSAGRGILAALSRIQQ